ncbi:MAG: hypothetical protein A2010_03915 [Nitrospirae bacterium GWD2_57_9]|nr:MAG: hypothetical protein A2010_03915 [Nitrospirae bacterium GWD2_57_9]
MERTDTPKVKDWEWKWLYNILDASTGLDPYFLDPYYVANANLTWGAGMVEETNVLLGKGSHYRDWDWQLPFFRGFNYFYFLGKNNEAAQSLLEASRRPGANPLFASLAAKLMFKENKTEEAVLFLEEIVKTTEDNVLKKLYLVRLESLKAILALEQAVAVYKKRYGIAPVKIEALIQKGVLNELPKEPYGGKYYIDPQGAIKTTKESMLLPHRR